MYYIAFSTAIVAAGKRLSVTLYVHCMPCYLHRGFQRSCPLQGHDHYTLKGEYRPTEGYDIDKILH